MQHWCTGIYQTFTHQLYGENLLCMNRARLTPMSSSGIMLTPLTRPMPRVNTAQSLVKEYQPTHYFSRPQLLYYIRSVQDLAERLGNPRLEQATVSFMKTAFNLRLQHSKKPLDHTSERDAHHTQRLTCFCSDSTLTCSIKAASFVSANVLS